VINTSLLEYQAAIIFCWFFALYIIELPFILKQPLKTKTNRSRFFKNLAFGCINKLLLPICTSPLLLLAIHLQPWHYTYSTNKWLAIIIFLNIALLDLASYFYHRLTHRIKFLWKYHEIHHLDETLDATTGLRIHFGELFIGALFRAPVIIICSIPLESVLVFELIVSMNGIFHHTNIKLPKMADTLLSYIFVTPRWHATHHHAIPKDTNSNYGFIFIWWDFLFGTLNRAKRDNDWIIGLKYSKDKSLLSLIAYPFSRIYLRHLN